MVNRPLVKSIFTGGGRTEYARDRHTLWYDELMKKEKSKAKVQGEAKEETKVANRSGKEEFDMASVLKVKGMSCQHCVMSVKKALGRVEGILNVEVDLEKGEVCFENTKSVASNRIEKVIEDAGYQVVPS
jgi:copper chaperone